MNYATELKGKFFADGEINPADYHEYYIYRCEGGYKVWTHQPLRCEVEGMEEVTE